MSKRFIKNGIIMCLFLLMTSCASIYTLTTDAREIGGGSCMESCQTIPRIYSGTVMDFCGAFLEDGGQGSAIMFYDLFLSIPVDTVVLPYTIYSQIRYGHYLDVDQCNSDQDAPDAQAG